MITHLQLRVCEFEGVWKRVTEGVKKISSNSRHRFFVLLIFSKGSADISTGTQVLLSILYNDSLCQLKQRDRWWLKIWDAKVAEELLISRHIHKETVSVWPITVNLQQPVTMVAGKARLLVHVGLFNTWTHSWLTVCNIKYSWHSLCVCVCVWVREGRVYLWFLGDCVLCASVCVICSCAF